MEAIDTIALKCVEDEHFEFLHFILIKCASDNKAESIFKMKKDTLQCIYSQLLENSQNPQKSQKSQKSQNSQKNNDNILQDIFTILQIY